MLNGHFPGLPDLLEKYHGRLFDIPYLPLNTTLFARLLIMS